jgi:hypothetical protein
MQHRPHPDAPSLTATAAATTASTALGRHTAAVAAILGLALGCASADPKPEPAAATPEGVPVENPSDEPLKWNEDMNRDQRKIGLILLELDKSLRIWNDLVLAGRTTRDAHSVKLIEEAITHDAATHFDEIVDQLAGGPPNNRRIAAAALGFSRIPRALAPLLAALSDADAEVVSNALLSLGTLRAPETPLTRVAGFMTDHPAPNVRNNAARALRALLSPATIEEERAAARTAARRAIGDADPAVRTSALLLLAELGDYESLERIAVALDDEVALVARAASRAVAHIGANRAQSYGTAARALTAAMLRVEAGAVRDAIRTDLQTLSGRNYGDDDDEWLMWANRLP